jgi:hypothetical protein
MRRNRDLLLSRRLRVRDDGTGKVRETDCTFAEFESEEAIILLGDSGTGKTTLFKEVAGPIYTTVRKFLIDPPVGGEALFLDGLDEYRNIASGKDASAEVSKALCSLKKPKFRLSCRAADWYGSTDQEVLRVASASGRVVVLELLPLSRDEILNAVQGIVPDPDVFLDEAESAGLGKLLGNPQTLKLLAQAWGSDKKPRNKFEAYEIGVFEQLRETNDQHGARGVASSDPIDLRKAAGAAASVLLLSNSIGISRAEPAVGNGYWGLSVVPYPDSIALDTVLRRRLFTSQEVDRFEFVHRTIAEFLAAEDLSVRIQNGLPIDRVMALICGIDGKPASSLRGLFAWLMCRLGYLAEDYVALDPYGVATYGDASVLSPGAQCAIWSGLQELRDPWFLTNEDDRGTFRDLANLNTAKIIRELLQDSITEVHLKIAALETIASSTENIGLDKITREIVLEKHDNTWLRSKALNAFAKSVQNDSAKLEALDRELAISTDDKTAPEVRVYLLRLTPAYGSLTSRLLSILEQAASAGQEQHTIGHLFQLIDLPNDADLDTILDGASRVLIASKGHYGLRYLFDKWLKRRLESPAEIKPMRLANWLRHIWGSRNSQDEKTLESLKTRFRQEPSLFEGAFDQLAQVIPNEKHSFWLFVAHDIWGFLPATVWPVSQCEFFLQRAEKEVDPERAADFFRMYLSGFPLVGGSAALTEAGLNLLDRRHDVAKALGDWRYCKIEKWRKDQWKAQDKESKRNLMNRAKNIDFLAQRLTTVRDGSEEGALEWAAFNYLDFFGDTKDVSDPRERIVRLTNEEIADALIQGIARYAENPNIPDKNAVIESWLANSIPRAHVLLSLSVFLRHITGMRVPEDALPHCIAAVVTAFHAGDKVPDYDKTLSAWLLHEVRKNPTVVKSVLKEIWIACTKNERNILPGFYEIEQDLESRQFLSSLSADVLRAGINDNHEIVGMLVSLLLHEDQLTASAIGEVELSRNELSAKVRTIWITTLFVIDPSTYLALWKTLMSDSDTSLWEAIEIIKGDRSAHRRGAQLTTTQRSEVITALGMRFPKVGFPSSGWSGSRNPWDAAEFIGHQIRLLATDGSAEAGIQLERLENDDGLADYHKLIRHHRSQHEKQQRESQFSFGTPEQVAEAIRNRAPATPNDLLAFIVDHLGVLASEIARTQRERYRAYWNESGRNLIKPKHEEACSGFLAEDLQNRIKAHGLIVTTEHHMIADKECDLVVLQGSERLLPIEVKHHYHAELWTAWCTQLDRLYTRDAKAGGLGIYLILWSGEARERMMPKLPNGLVRPTSAAELKIAVESLIPEADRHRLRVIVVDISRP